MTQKIEFAWGPTIFTFGRSFNISNANIGYNSITSNILFSPTIKRMLKKFRTYLRKTVR